ncbi:MAG TPA: DUF962 domain-containing protein [Gemmataceae bacterium]|jgi:hypothetical protein|nr:DUF962 domain-containing protein [Gemmataceae bacterium]
MRTFAEFWPYYVREHSNRTNRYLHFIGTLSALVLAVTLVVMGWWWLALALPVVGYGFAWVGHFVIEKNRPATFRHPLWSLLGDFKMFGLMAVGRMEAELEKARRDPRS